MAVDMFLKLDSINGESTDIHHLKWIDLESFSWGVTSPVTISAGGVGAGRPVPSDFTVVMPFSAASPLIFQTLVTGAHLDSATVSVRQAGADNDFLKYDFDTLFMTKLDWVAGEDRPSEEVAFQFEKITVDYFVTRADGSLGQEVRAGFDFLKFTKI